MEVMKTYPCPCCGFLTRSEEDFGTFEICPVCGWEDDDLQAFDPSFSGGANVPSLEEAKRTYQRIGAISRDALDQVRPANSSEYPTLS